MQIIDYRKIKNIIYPLFFFVEKDHAVITLMTKTLGQISDEKNVRMDYLFYFKYRPDIFFMEMRIGGRTTMKHFFYQNSFNNLIIEIQK